MSHPTADELTRLLTRTGDTEPLARHVDGCPTCRRRLDELGDASLVGEVRSLLEHVADDAAEAIPAPARVGPFRVLEEVGRGGMGVVYRAEQEHPHREVALKLVHPRLVGPAALRRFSFEVETLGRLHHPSIARLYQAGTTRRGDVEQPWFAMEFVRGRRLDRHLASSPGAGVGGRLDLFLAVCDAVQHAHTRGVIHRDLKPGNILVSDDGRPVVIDFGLARALDAGVDRTLHTQSGLVLGTLPYMAPEQLGNDPDAIDTRTDVYGLGCVLYELLAGSPPLDISDASLVQAARLIEERRPRPPSAVRPGLPRTLDWIVLTALAKEKDRRYASAAALAEDVRRFRTDRPVLARRAGTVYLAGLFWRRHKLAVSLAALLLLSLVGGLAGTLVNLERARRETRRANAAASEAARQEVLAREAQRAAEQEAVRADAAAERASREAERARRGWEQAELRLEAANRLTAAFGDVFRYSSPAVHRGEELTTREALDIGLPALLAGIEGWGRLAGRLLHFVGTVYQTQGAHDRAESLLQESREALAARRDEIVAFMEEAAAGGTAGGSPPAEGVYSTEEDLAAVEIDLASTERDLAVVWSAQGRGEQAASLLGDVIDRLARTAGNDAPETLAARADLAAVLDALGRRDEAEEVLRSVLAARASREGPRAAPTLAARHALGALLVERGRLDEARGLLEETLRGRRETLSADHPDTLSTALELAAVHWGSGDLAAAETLYRDTLDRRLRALGPDHIGTLNAMELLAGFLKYAGRFDEAEPLLEQAVALSRERFGVEHEATLFLMNQLASNLLEQWRRDEAVAVMEEAVAASRRALGDTHPDTLLRMANLGYLYLRTGRRDEAEPLLREAYDGALAAYGADDPRLYPYVAALARLHDALDRTAEALALHRQAVELAVRRDGPDAPEALQSLFRLGIFLKNRVYHDEAEAVLADVLTRAEAAHGADNPVTLLARHGLAELYWATFRHAEAEPLAREAYLRRRALLGPSHEGSLESLELLVRVLLEQDRAGEARSLAETLVEDTPAGAPERPPRIDLLEAVRRRVGTPADS